MNAVSVEMINMSAMVESSRLEEVCQLLTLAAAAISINRYSPTDLDNCEAIEACQQAYISNL